MTYKGKMRNGVIVLSEGAALPEGTAVSVSEIKRPRRGKKKAARKTHLGERLLKFAGAAGPGLPRDLAKNHDHNLYGFPTR